MHRGWAGSVGSASPGSASPASAWPLHHLPEAPRALPLLQQPRGFLSPWLQLGLTPATPCCAPSGTRLLLPPPQSSLSSSQSPPKTSSISVSASLQMLLLAAAFLGASCHPQRGAAVPGCQGSRSRAGTVGGHPRSPLAGMWGCHCTEREARSVSSQSLASSLIFPRTSICLSNTTIRCLAEQFAE